MHILWSDTPRLAAAANEQRKRQLPSRRSRCGTLSLHISATELQRSFESAVANASSKCVGPLALPVSNRQAACIRTPRLRLLCFFLPPHTPRLTCYLLPLLSIIPLRDVTAYFPEHVVRVVFSPPRFSSHLLLHPTLLFILVFMLPSSSSSAP